MKEDFFQKHTHIDVPQSTLAFPGKLADQKALYIMRGVKGRCWEHVRIEELRDSGMIFMTTWGKEAHLALGELAEELRQEQVPFNLNSYKLGYDVPSAMSYYRPAEDADVHTFYTESGNELEYNLVEQISFNESSPIEQAKRGTGKENAAPAKQGMTLDEQISPVMNKLTKMLQANGTLEKDDCAYRIPWAAGDELPAEDVKEILESKDPWTTLYNAASEAFVGDSSYEYDFISDELDKAVQDLENSDKKLLDEYLDYTGKELMDAWGENQNFAVWYDEADLAKHQHILLDVMMDDYASGYKNDELISDKPIPKDASILKLAETQGQLRPLLSRIQALREDRTSAVADGTSPFLDSTINELMCGAGSKPLAFLADVTLDQAIQLSEAIRRENTLEKATGTITFSKDTICGLFDKTGRTAGDSCMDIRLEQPSTIPIKGLAIADDRSLSNSVQNAFMISKSAWTPSAIQSFNPMTDKQIQAALKTQQAKKKAPAASR